MRPIIAGNNAVIVQANTIDIHFPELNGDLASNPLRTLDEIAQWINGLKYSSFSLVARDALLHVYKLLDAKFVSAISTATLAQISRELALLQMDCGEITGHECSAIPLFLKASRLARISNPSAGLYELHMIGVCAGIQGRTKRAIALFNACKNNLPSGRRFRPHYAHILRDTGIALNRFGQFEAAKSILAEAKSITENWHSEFNFAIDAQKLSIAFAGLGELDAAFRLIEQASHVLEYQDDLSYVKNLNAKHFFAIKCGDGKQATKLYREIVEISDKRGYPHQKKIVYAQHNLGITR